MTTTKYELKKYEYTTNNSGGRWWLSDQNWQDLEAAGWTVDWAKDWADSPHEYMRSWASKDGRYMGALAKSASKEFYSHGEAVAEWERVTGQYYADQGCNCCGRPHCIDEEYEYVE